MTEPKLIHVLQPGQELASRFREVGSQVFKNLQAMRLTPDSGIADPLVHVTFVDDSGVSLYINRTYLFGGDIEAFLPKDLVMWQSYFNPLNRFNMSYARTRHYKKRFPLDFL